jgi:hypothetical protein
MFNPANTLKTLNPFIGFLRRNYLNLYIFLRI